MVTLMVFLIVPFVILGLILAWCVGMYNTLVTMNSSYVSGMQ